MKKLMIFVLAGLLLVFGASAVLANPQADNNSGTGGLTGNTLDSSGAAGSVSTGIGDTAANGSTQNINETKSFDNSTNTKTIDKSGQTNSLLSDNTTTVDATGIASEAEKNIAGAQAAGGSTANNSISVPVSDVANDKSNSQSNSQNDNSNQDNVNVAVGDVSVPVSSSKAKYGSASAVNGNATATNTKTKTVTIDKSGQNNSKTLYAVDNQVMAATTASPIPGFGNITQTMNKTFSASTNNSFGGFTGIANNATAAGNFNTTTAYTSISVGGNVNPGP